MDNMNKAKVINMIHNFTSLYFIFGMDVDDNELLAMESIHLFVELMDQYFSNVCELDIETFLKYL